MLPRDRVIAVIEHREPDRIPIYAWVKANLEKQISNFFGSVEAFEDRYEFDFAHIFGGPFPYPAEKIKNLQSRNGGMIEPAVLLDINLSDPNENGLYDDIRQAVAHHKTQRGRFVYVQTPGIFECLSDQIGIENHLLYLGLSQSDTNYEQELRELYRRRADWNCAFAMNCLDLGVDMIHVSDDWGGQHNLLFSPKTWWDIICPYHRITCNAVRKRNAYLSLHSDGNISQVIDGIIQLGYQVVHPYQESAGMDLNEYKRRYADSFVIMGGLDVQTTIGFGNFGKLTQEIERILRMFRKGGLLFCTSHFVQNHCSMEELAFAYDFVRKFVNSNRNK